ncbi:zinc finger protein 624 [Dendroctonus ponderosae]|uniref:zinc finger protein 624 n=1 Tax=Dendroctonus ponderosae TaxID=77166 RepID=UPI00203535CA|nr:zinc finger protein 624 [Dendroctonus ponderosae]KAH0999269.1 hypothetical protein HUJ05_007645 [Dendroctonus ponderosae]
MEAVIKEGALRLLITESTCDVILSCSDHRLLAHKFVLSVASPVFKELLQQCPSDSTSVIILPDVSGSIMSTILDYIYTGRTLICSQAIDDFLAASKFLKIAIDMQHIKDIYKSLDIIQKPDYNNGDILRLDVKDNLSKPDDSQTKDAKKSTENNRIIPKSEAQQTKPDKKLPDLLPIEIGMFKRNVKKMCNAVMPSPWSQRREKKIFEDPRIVSLKPQENEIQKTYDEDPNNNMESEPTKESSKRLENIIRHLRLNSSEVAKEKSIQNNDTETEIRTSLAVKKHDPTTNKNVCLKDTACEKRVELPKFTNFPFSRHLTQLVPFGGNYLPDNIEKSSYSSESSIGKETSKCNSICSLDIPKTYSTVTQTCAPLESVEISESFVDAPSNIPERKVCSDRMLDFNENSNSNQQNNSIENSTSDSSNDDSKGEDINNVKKKQFKCEQCGKSFSQLRNYKYHRSVHEGTKEFSTKCPECGKTFNDKGYLSSHLKIHRDRKEYECPHCPKRFNQRVAYNMHLRIHTGLKPHNCPTCGKSFSRKMLLKQHQRVHTGERPYSCPECGKTFADRSNMSLHTRLHTGNQVIFYF